MISTVGQCWNILEPIYFGFNIEGILKAANANTDGLSTLKGSDGTGPTYYTYSDGTTRKGISPGPYTIPASHKRVSLVEDTFDRWSLVANRLNEQVKEKLNRMKTGWGNTIKTPPIDKPLYISIAMASLSFVGIFIGLFIGCFIESCDLYIFMAIILSLSAITSVISGILLANHWDKSKMKAMTFTGITFQYKGEKLELFESTDSNQNITPTKTGEVTVLATQFTSTKNHFYIADSKKPRVEFKTAGDGSGIDNQTEDLAEDNITAVIGIFHCSM